MRTETAVAVNEKTRSSSKILTALAAVLISMTMCTGFTLMTGTTFGIDISVARLVILSLITALVYTAVFYLNKRWISFGALISAPVIFTCCVAFNWFDVKKGIYAFLYYIKLYVFLWLPGDYAEDPDGGRTILALIAAYNLIAISITVFVLMKRRWIPVALLPFAPLFFFSVTNTDVSPKQAPCLIAGAGLIMVLLSNAFRKKKQTTYAGMLILLMIPVFAFMFILGGIFPQNKYNKDKLATNILIELRDAVDRAAGRDNPVRDIIERALNGFENTDFDDSFDAISPLYSSPTNLSRVGPFNPSTTEILKVYRSNNPSYSGRAPCYAGNVLYLKVESSDHYANNTLTSTKIKGSVYARDAEPVKETAQYGIAVMPLKSSSVDIVPYYTDHYYIDNPITTKLNPYNYTHERITGYASANVPVRTGNIYSQNYLERYVYKTCLEVPYATDRALINGGNLPDWYLDVYYGRATMSDAEKVRKVTEFVRSLHPYDINTDYPPQGADFVSWFVNDANSGICVHYAVSSMVLLRMIGIPSRYVRGYVDQNSGIDKESTIYASQAHAWFEVFNPEYGWVMGDATPGYGIDENNFNLTAIARVNPDIESAEFGKTRNTPTETETATSETEPETSEETAATSETETSETTSEAMPTEEPSVETAPDGSSVFFTGENPSPDGHNQTVFELPKYVLNFIRFLVTCVVVLIVILMLVLAARIVFMLHWLNRFKAEKINDRIVSYYHYFSLMSRVFRFIYPAAVTEIAEKATFSGKELSAKELDTLVATCIKIMKISSVDFPRPKKLLFRLMSMPMK